MRHERLNGEQYSLNGSSAHWWRSQLQDMLAHVCQSAVGLSCSIFLGGVSASRAHHNRLSRELYSGSAECSPGDGACVGECDGELLTERDLSTHERLSGDGARLLPSVP